MSSPVRTAGQQQSVVGLLNVNIAVLLGAYGFEILGGLAPCLLCYYQRGPYFLAIMLCSAAWFRPGWGRTVFAILMVVYLAGAGLGAYHAGVEWKFWPGPASCTALDSSDVPIEELMARILAAPIVRCDEIPWSLFGISLAGYNALISLGLLTLSALALRQGNRRHNDERA
ncbi:MAG: disulfide bond formation protein B [Alphaproteobacteria bacterium]